MMTFRTGRRNFFLAIAIFCTFLPYLVAARETQHSHMPKDGYVPNASTAISIAEAVLVPIYGKEQIEKQKPLNATLSEGVWMVSGTLPEGMMGGVAEIEISRQSGKILRVTHGK